MIGTSVGPYQILAELGRGGMGEVYRARDSRLNRDVAIKILPEILTADPDRVARFEREAQLLASLNHPNIAQIYGLEGQEGREGIRALVLELVEGQTLAERIAQGPLPLDEALTMARQIASALAAAHEQGIIHRDLKPANIKLRPDGTVKVLDFGLAKALDPAASRGPSSVSMSPTLTAATQLGVILGTAAYMAPEQARGKSVDKRADIWAFGCVLFEMLSGQRAFHGEEVSDTLAFVITKDVDWSALPASMPPNVRRVLRRCLEKDPKRRFHDIADAQLELDEPIDAESAATAIVAAAPPSRGWRAVLVPTAAALAAAAVAGGGVWLAMRPVAVVPPPVQRFPVPLPASAPYIGEVGGAIAISPDGTRMVYAARENERRLLYVRNMDQLEGTAIRGTDDAYNPFFSPDGEWVGFFTGAGQGAMGRLKKVAIRGGPALTIAETSIPYGVWTADDTIVFTRSEASSWSLYRIPAAGGQPARLTTPDTSAREVRHGLPERLPGTNALLFAASLNGPSFENARVMLLQPDGKTRTIIEHGYAPRYVPSGHIVYALGGNLMAVPFDGARLEVRGAPVPVVEGVRGRVSTGEVCFGVSPTGFLLYSPGPTATFTARRELVWVDRKGQEEVLNAPQRGYLYPRLSPDGTKIALDVRDQENDIWVWDLVRSNLTRLTVDPGNNTYPVWTPDGARVAFSAVRSGSGVPNLFWQASDGTGKQELLVEASTPQVPQSITPDGRMLLFRNVGASSAADVLMLPLAGNRQPVDVIRTNFVEQNAEISPDGRWLAYQSNESGATEVFVRPFPNVDASRVQVSTNGGTRPLWSRTGKELFYLHVSSSLDDVLDDAVEIMAVPITPGSTFAAGKPTVAVKGRYLAGSSATGRTYDASPDGQRFLLIKTSSAGPVAAVAPLVAVLHFGDELRRLAPPRR